MFLTVSKSKDKGKIEIVHDLNTFRHFFKKNNFFINLLIYETGWNNPGH
jgi:hypothetical protein